MPGQSKTGSNFVVAFSLPRSLNPETDGYVVINAASVREFSMTFSLNSMPVGHAKCILNHTADVPVGGSYGVMFIQDYDSDAKADIELGIYISNLVQGQNSTDSMVIDFSFTVGSKESDMKQKNFAHTGTSCSAMKECASRSGMECLLRYSDNGKNTDTMTWRLVNGNFSENMNYVVSSSYVPSDILFWSFDESIGKIVISTFNTEKASKNRAVMIYSQDALLSTQSAVYRPKGLKGTSVFRYQSMSRADHTDRWRSALYPNLVVDTTSSSGEKETGDCGGECLEVIMTSAGAGELPEGLRPPENSTWVYGEPKMAMAFPMNGHRKYAVADTIRSRLLAEYGRSATVRIFNHFGPPVGSCVYLVAKNPMFSQGNISPDSDYTARYIVLSKDVRKITSTTTGTLGNRSDTMTTEYETILELATNYQYSKNRDKEYGIVMGLVGRVVDAAKET